MIEIAGLNYDVDSLERIHSTPEHEFMPIVQAKFPHAEFLETPDGRQLIYVNNNKNIIGIAHLDGTMPATHFGIGKRYKPEGKHDTVIYSPFVDDRLGAYALLELLPQIDIEVDLLFSVGEEIGDPTSRFFNPPREYNWMFQFDRGGTDAVCYQYNGAEWLDSLHKHFGTIYVGSFSDIAYMWHLNCHGVNIGTGYHDYMRDNAWASLDELTEQVYKFETFYDEFYDRRFEFDSQKYVQDRLKARAAQQKGKKGLKFVDNSKRNKRRR